MRGPLIVIVSLMAMAATPALAQFRSFAGGGGYPGGGGGYPGGGGGGYPAGGGSGMSGMNAPTYSGPTGSMFYPGFGWSSHPLNTPYGGGYGAYNPYGAYGYGAPITGVPMPMSGGLYRVGAMPFGFFQGSSGYYYPWSAGATQTTIYQLNQNQMTAAQPPVDTMLSDMGQYLDSSKKKGQLSDGDYQHLFRRLHDLQAKYHHLVTEDDGDLDLLDARSIRAEANALGTEIATRVKPLAPTAK